MLAIISDYRNDLPSFQEIEDQLKNISEAGFSHVHWCHDWEGDYLYANEEMYQAKEWFEKYGLKAKGVHSTEGGVRTRITENGKEVIHSYRNRYDNRKDFTSLSEYNRIAGRKLQENRIEFANVIGSKELVMHMQYPYKELESKDLYDAYWKSVFKSFDEMMDFAMERGVRIAIENLLYTPMELQIHQLEKLFGRYPKEYMGFCFDSGHAYLMEKEDPFRSAKLFKDRLIAIHLSDHMGKTFDDIEDAVAISNADNHYNIMTGVIEWEKIAEVIADSVYELPIVLEICMSKKDKGNDKAFLKEALANGNKLTEWIINNRD